MDRKHVAVTRRLLPGVLALALCGVAMAQADDTPTWAYPVTPPSTTPRRS